MINDRTLLIAIPCYTGAVSVETLKTVVDGLQEASRMGFDGCCLWTYSGDGRIIHVRNRIVSEFWDAGFSDLILLDDDVGASGGSIGRLLSYPVDFVAGVYPARKDPEEYCVRWLHEDAAVEPDWYIEEDAETGLMRVAGVPAGFLRITRACAGRMIAHYKEGAYPNAKAPGKTVYRLFDWDLRVAADWGEDISFCKRWRDIGGDVWIDPGIRLTHTGPKMFKGCIGDWLEQKRQDKHLLRIEVAA